MSDLIAVEFLLKLQNHARHKLPLLSNPADEKGSYCKAELEA